MSKIAITGAPQTGKSIVSHALSYMTGLPVIQKRTYLEYSNDFEFNKQPKDLYWDELFALYSSFFIDGVELETQNSEGFISDGSVFSELIFAKSRIKFSKKISTSPLKKIVNSIVKEPFIKEYEKMFHSIEKLIKEYLVNHYDFIIHIGVNQLYISNNEYHKFREIYDTQLVEFYTEQGLKYKVYNSLNLKQTLTDIIFDSGIDPLFSAESALFKAKKQLHLDNELNKDIYNVSIIDLAKCN
jgi:hypothetical protein